MQLDTIYPYLCLYLGSVLFYLAIRAIHYSYNRIRFYQALKQRGQQVIGKVKRLREERSNLDNESTTYPIVTYQVNGQTYETEPHALLYEQFTIDQEVNLRFLPENPADCTWRKTAIVEIILFLLGVCYVVIAVVAIVLLLVHLVIG